MRFTLALLVEEQMRVMRLMTGDFSAVTRTAQSQNGPIDLGTRVDNAGVNCKSLD